MDEMLVLDVDELVDYVFARLVAEGHVADKEMLTYIFELENDFLIENGLAFVAEDDEDDEYEVQY